MGGADRTVCIWDVESGKVLYKLPGHKGTVTSVDFHPKEPISAYFFLFFCFHLFIRLSDADDVVFFI